MNSVIWFEIPVKDLNRATTFYSNVLGIDMPVQEYNGKKMSFFGGDGFTQTGGCLVLAPNYTPSHAGTRVYFDCGYDLQPFLDKVEPAGGKVTIPKTLICETIGHSAEFIDPDGNTVCLFSRYPKEEK